MLNPIHHARTPEQVARYKVEPYVMAADIYSVAPHAGRGGWTWYTGSSAWMYRAGIEGLLGLHRQGRVLRVRPCIPLDWPGFEATVTVDGVCHTVRVDQQLQGDATGSCRAWLDGQPADWDEAGVQMPLDATPHVLCLSIGRSTKTDSAGARAASP